VSRERCQGDMGDSDYTERAFRAYFRAGANIQPSASSSGLRSHEGRDYVVLENCNGILAATSLRARASLASASLNLRVWSIRAWVSQAARSLSAMMACSRSEVCLGSLIEAMVSPSQSAPH
jgi:hypothetical protein